MSVKISTADYQRLLDIEAVAGDLWNELENCRPHWETWPNAHIVAEYIDRYETAAADV